MNVIEEIGGTRFRLPGWEWECSAPGPLLTAATAPLGRLLARTTGQRRRFVTGTVGNLGRHATPLAPQPIALLDDDDARYEAVTALGRVGRAAAPAAAALGRLLATTDKPSHRTDIAYALGEIGPPASVAMPALRALIAESAAVVCKRGSPDDFPRFLSAAIKIGPPPGEPSNT